MLRFMLKKKQYSKENKQKDQFMPIPARNLFECKMKATKGYTTIQTYLIIFFTAESDK